MVTRRLHRLLGVALVAPFLAWTATGLLFLVKPGWRGAYESLDAFRDEAFDPMGLAPFSIVSAKPGEPGAAVRVEMGTTGLGLVYRVHGSDGTRLVDARTGSVISPLDRDAATKVAVDATSRARAVERYGAVRESREDGDTIEVAFEGGAVVRVGRSDLSLAQSGADTSRIDLLYRLHYLQWTGVAAIDRPLALAAIGGTWILAALGLRLFRKRPDA